MRFMMRRRSKPSGYVKIESLTEKSAIYIDEKGVQTHTRDVHSEKCGQETDTSTLADSLDVRRDNERNPVPPMSSSPTVHQRSTLGLKHLGSRIGDTFQMAFSKSKKSLTPWDICQEIELHWWTYKTGNSWERHDVAIKEGSAVTKRCIELIKCIKYGDSNTCEEALDVVAHLLFKYATAIEPVFVHNGVIYAIDGILERAGYVEDHEKHSVSSISDTRVLRCRRVLTALSMTTGWQVTCMHTCFLSQMHSGGSRSMWLLDQLLMDKEFAFFNVRSATAMVYNSPGKILAGFIEFLFLLLNHIHVFHDLRGLDDLYWWTLSRGGEDPVWPYLQLSPDDVVNFKLLTETLCGEEYGEMVKENMPATYTLALGLNARE